MSLDLSFPFFLVMFVELVAADWASDAVDQEAAAPAHKDRKGVQRGMDALVCLSVAVKVDWAIVRSFAFVFGGVCVLARGFFEGAHFGLVCTEVFAGGGVVRDFCFGEK